MVSFRLLGGKHVVAAVSGGVSVDTSTLAAADKVKTDTYGLMAGERKTSAAKELPRRAWWWD